MVLGPARVAADGTGPVYRLKPGANATRWLFTASETERSSLKARGWVDEGVAAHVHADAGTGRVQLLRFTNGREWRLALPAQKESLLQAGYTLDGPLGHVYAEWHEGGVIEPNVRDGCAYLDILRGELRLVNGPGCTS